MRARSQAWSKPLANGDVAVVLYNKGDDSAWGGGGPAVDVEITWTMLGWDDVASGAAVVSMRASFVPGTG